MDTDIGRTSLQFDSPPDRIVVETAGGSISLKVPDVADRTIAAGSSDGDIDIRCN